MSESIDGLKSEPKPPQAEGLTGEEVWNSLLKSQQKGEELTPAQQRALDLREISISCVNALDKIINDGTIKDDPTQEAETVATYWDSLFKLQDMGIENGMKTGHPIEFYRYPLNAAEYIAGQLLNTQRDNLPNARQALREAEEHSEGNESTNDKILQYTVPAKMFSKKAIDFMVLRSEVNILRGYLAADKKQVAQTTTHETA